MRSKNTESYESQNRNFRYTLLAVLGVLIVVGVLAYALRAMNGEGFRGQDPLNIGEENAQGGPMVNGGQQYDGPGAGEDVNVSQQVPSDPVPSVDSLDVHDHGQADEDGEFSTGLVAPVEGAKVLKPYSREVPLYSVTLEQYAAHAGVDYEAPADSQVRAIDEGTVIAVYKDDKLGVTIEIDHGNGWVSKYANLSTMEMVETGDVVKRGQVISGVGNSALFEILDPEHLHFELWNHGQAVDPAEHF